MNNDESGGFHIVRPSPWPIFTSCTACGLFVSFAFFLHNTRYSGIASASFLILLLSAMFLWWRDVVDEAITEGAHTGLVKRGLRVGMVFFILSEIMFFAVFFSSLFKSWLDPSFIIEDYWPAKLLSWPPEGIETLNAWNLPLLNTFILLLSGTSITWGHYGLLKKDNRTLVSGTAATVFLGVCFTLLQLYEYSHASFSFNEDGYKSIYSSNFYVATGFHGIHVLVGTIFLSVCLFRAIRRQFTVSDHLGFEFAAWYWHFVDVVWLFLFTFLYWFSSL